MTPRDVVLVVAFGFTGSRLVEQLRAAGNTSVLKPPTRSSAVRQRGRTCSSTGVWHVRSQPRCPNSGEALDQRIAVLQSKYATLQIALDRKGVGTSRALMAKYRQVEIVPRTYFSIPNLKAES